MHNFIVCLPLPSRNTHLAYTIYKEVPRKEKTITERIHECILANTKECFWCSHVEHPEYPAHVLHRLDVVAFCIVSHAAIGATEAVVGRRRPQCAA